MNDELIDLQTRFAYQEHTIQELSNVVYKQQKMLDKLAQEVKSLKEQMLLGDSDQKPMANVPPPHY